MKLSFSSITSIACPAAILPNIGILNIWEVSDLSIKLLDLFSVSFKYPFLLKILYVHVQ